MRLIMCLGLQNLVTFPGVGRADSRISVLQRSSLHQRSKNQMERMLTEGTTVVCHGGWHNAKIITAKTFVVLIM